MKEPLTLFGKRLRALRVDNGYSQKQLGIMIGLDDGVASARMNQYEVGSHSPKFDLASKIANALGVSTSYFYADDEQTAQAILLFSKIKKEQQRSVLTVLEELANLQN